MRNLRLLTMAIILFFGIICEAEAYTCGSKAPMHCTSCVAYTGSNSCGKCEESFQVDRKNNVCLPKCAKGEVMIQSTCVSESSVCENGSVCIDSDGMGIRNCCYKVEGDTTTLYKDDSARPLSLFSPNSPIVLPDNKNLIVSDGISDISGSILDNFDSAYISENSNLSSGCWCCTGMDNIKHLIVHDNAANLDDWRCGNNGTFDIVCLGDVENCRTRVPDFIKSRIVSPTESQCNTSGSYYFTGSECTKRPTDGTDITCEHEISGYVKVGNYCVSPENSYAKKHYTPAEAAQWLKDDNTNFVVLTFKK